MCVWGVSPSYHPTCGSVVGDLQNSERQFLFLSFHRLSLLLVRNLVITRVFEGKGSSSSWFSCLSAPPWF